MDLEAGSRLGHYHLIETLGQGGMGVVWRARDERLGREVAIKVLSAPAADAEGLSRLEREARVIAALNHPHIVTLHSIEHDAGHLFLTMECLEGRPLAELIGHGGLRLDRLLGLALPIVEAVAAAHRRGILHGDLKPSNVMVCADGRPKVLDFGLARVHGPGATAVPSAEAALGTELSGTPAYQAPERLRGEATDHRSDLFSLGVMLYEMATGRRPFPGGTLAEAVAAVLLDEPLPPSVARPELPAALDAAIMQCLEKDPARRPASAEALFDRLETVATAAREAGDGPPSLAVLPFLDASEAGDRGYFSEGVSDEIHAALVRTRGLRVAARSASYRFRAGGLDDREIGRRLGVRALLHGRVRTAGGRVSVVAELTDVEEGWSLWSQRFERDAAEIFAIQEEIATGVARALEVRLSGRQERALRGPSTRHLQAYDCVLRGRRYYAQYNRRGAEFARQLFTRAIELDPDYADAHAGLADALTFLFQHAERDPALRRGALEASDRALALDPGSAEALVARGLACSLGGDHEAAGRAFESAIALDPTRFEAHYFYARETFIQGRLEKAERLYRRAMELRPEDYQAPLLVAQILDDLGRREDAASVRRRGVRLAEERVTLHPDDVRALYMGANGLVALGERERGLAMARRAEALDPGDAMLLYNLGCIAALAGEREAALEYLERSVAAGMNRPDWIRNDSNLEAVRDDPRLAALVRRLESPPGAPTPGTGGGG